MENGTLSVASLLCSPSHNGRKRPYEQMSRSSSTTCASRLSSSSTSNNASASSSTVFGNINIRLPPMRYVGDGLDMRRPPAAPQTPPEDEPQIHGRTRQDVIDLTMESSTPPPNSVLPPERVPGPLARRPGEVLVEGPRRRSPRHRRDHVSDPPIIDLSVEDDPPLRLRSPDIQFLSSRQRSSSLNIDDRRSTQAPAFAPGPAEQPPLPAPPLQPWMNRLSGLSVPTFSVGPLRARLAQGMDQLVGWETGFAVPNVLDFETVGFNLEQPIREPPAQPRSPTYEAPSDPSDGFTRSPTEDDILVCPNCEDELTVGQDEVKRQVWIVRPCGHVYCGECIQNRAISKRKYATKPGKTSKAFSKCVVSGCGKSVKTPSSVMQVYL